jgi:hypothetical protein
MKKSARYSPKVTERAVRMVQETGSEYESQWTVMQAQPTPIRPFQKSPLAIFRVRHLYQLSKARSRPH